MTTLYFKTEKYGYGFKSTTREPTYRALPAKPTTKGEKAPKEPVDPEYEEIPVVLKLEDLPLPDDAGEVTQVTEEEYLKAQDDLAAYADKVRKEGDDYNTQLQKERNKLRSTARKKLVSGEKLTEAEAAVVTL